MGRQPGGTRGPRESTSRARRASPVELRRGGAVREQLAERRAARTTSRSHAQRAPGRPPGPCRRALERGAQLELEREPVRRPSSHARAGS